MSEYGAVITAICCVLAFAAIASVVALVFAKIDERFTDIKHGIGDIDRKVNRIQDKCYEVENQLYGIENALEKRNDEEENEDE